MATPLADAADLVCSETTREQMILSNDQLVTEARIISPEDQPFPSFKEAIGRARNTTTVHAYDGVAPHRSERASIVRSGKSPFSLPVSMADQIFARAEAANESATDMRPVDHAQATSPTQRVDGDGADVLVGSLTLRDTAREALRNRLIAAAQPRERRSAYELVFLMLAFSVTVLVVAPPLVRVAYALHGTPMD